MLKLKHLSLLLQTRLLPRWRFNYELLPTLTLELDALFAADCSFKFDQPAGWPNHFLKWLRDPGRDNWQHHSRPCFLWPKSTYKSQAKPCPCRRKLSYKWSLDLRNHPDPTKRAEFKQALSQVNHYMKQHRARYGFILSDRELVAIRRLDGRGNLELSASIPWNESGTITQPRLTVLLGLWYLNILAANDQGWSL